MTSQYTLTEQTFRHTEENADSELRIASFNGVSIISGSGYQEEPMRREESRDQPYLDLFFCFEGTGMSCSYEHNSRYRFQSAQHGVLFNPGFKGYHYVESKVYRMLSIEMTELFYGRFMSDDGDFSSRFWNKVQRQQETSLAPHPMPLTGRQMAVINDLHYGRYSGYMKQLYLESRVVDLFLLQMDQAQQTYGQLPARIRQQDREKLFAAKEYVKQHMMDAFSLLQVAQHAGLNDFKLKKGFRELFGTTVFGYLNELKMNHAMHLLRETTRSVYEVADSLGYSETANFSKAFKKYFGQLPKDVKNHG